ncbi:M20/M25/M40 family metallo-hydrolase [Terrisporobacter petrolearius]|uniref:M20/M25/M40 family metallo-hydrolase n=1 Tax=Terrisporobacter petrolearius TaxID=1460447 RepID=UPI001D16B062|nr:M20/M25/M40 family metallo-hydrolase [Terrisporobacter petrolearius]MCC3866041.1 M20/M25/M40 family metallo-hydrolase [Terrisporobacter petrolearius]
MKKKFLAIIMAVAMIFSVFAYTPVSFAKENMGYGDYAYSVLQHLNKNLTQRIAGTEKELEAAEYLKEQLESFGYEVKIQNFTYERKNVTYNSQNVIASKKGASTKDVIIGSHYDSVGTNGVDDNGSGTVVNLETAKRLANKKTPYTVKFVFFGAEEVGLKGSSAYVNAMTEEEISNTVYMVNMDSMLAGTYRYVYSGNYNKETNKVDNAWPAYQTLKLSDALQTGMRLNNTDLNLDYPTPSTGNWSDHANFRKLMPYLYFEAVNWEVPDDPKRPEEGSSGAYETEIGEVMHNPERDNLEFVESTWGSRGKDTISSYCKLLEAIVYQLNPNGLITPSKEELKKAIEIANDLDKSDFSESSYNKFQQALKDAKVVNKTEYILLKDQQTIDKALAKLNETMAIVSSNIVNTTIKAKNQIYNNKYQRPEVIVKDGKEVLEEGKDYTVSYSNNKEIGTATVTVKGCNDYMGLAKANFSILPQTVKNLKTSDVLTNSLKLSWNKIINADGYKIYKYNASTKKYELLKTICKNTTITYKDTKIVSATSYLYKVSAYKKVGNKIYEGLKCEKVKVTSKPLQPILKLSSTTAKKVNLNYSSKVSKRSDGYEVYMSSSKNGKYTLIKDTQSTKITKNKLTSKKGYYFKVRAYRKVDGKKVYSSYSTIKYIKVK